MKKKIIDKKFEQVFYENYNKIYSYCLAKLKQGCEAYDCTQSAFAVLYAKMIDNVVIENQSAFLYKTANNYVMRCFAERSKSLKYNVELDFDMLGELPDDMSSLDFEKIENALSGDDYDHLVEKIKNCLNEIDFNVFSLRWIYSKNIKEICQITGLSEPCIKSKCMRIKHNIKKTLDL